jgi:hypothetical protein
MRKGGFCCHFQGKIPFASEDAPSQDRLDDRKNVFSMFSCKAMNTTNITRRHFFNDCAVGTGKIALASLLAESAYGAAKSPNVAATSHFQPKAKAVIHMFMAGAPSQLELFDHKPMLTKYEGKPLPPSVIGGQRYAFIRPDAAVLGPRFKFAKHGQCGADDAVQPRPGADFHEHRLFPAWTAQHGLVGDVWSRRGVAGFAELCRDEHWQRHQRRRSVLEQRFPAERVFRHALP